MTIEGVVQGVGFRPSSTALPFGLGLSGGSATTTTGCWSRWRGAADDVERFGRALVSEAPPLAVVEKVRSRRRRVRPASTASTIVGRPPRRGRRTLVRPDVATCDDCIGELFDPADRRYRHPFITCTNCGPRFTIITELPYDRPNTTMAGFELCPACAAEYHDPADRRFHAQPLACPGCGPRLRYEDDGGYVTTGSDAVIAAVQADMAAGRVVAIKGLGGYHLACDATDERAVARLRQRKERPDKPLAVMVADLDAARAASPMSTPSKPRRCARRRAPIVLLRRRPDVVLGARRCAGQPDGRGDAAVDAAPSSAVPRSPSRPTEVPGVLVMTSGNLVRRARSATATTRSESGWRRSPTASATHDRPIHVPCDDSVVRGSAAAVPIRRSRGYAPVPFALPFGRWAGHARRRRRDQEHVLRGGRSARLDQPAHRRHAEPRDR